MSNPAVLVIGAGPSGLVTALWLTRLGVPVRIVDKAATAGTTSRAVGVQARTLEFYGQLGLADTIVRSGVVVEAGRLWVRGRNAARVQFGRIGKGLSPFPFLLMYPQDEHEQLLVDTLATLGVQVERQVELVSMEQDATQVRATLRGKDGMEERCVAEYIVGGDGAHSVVRRAIGADFPGGTYAHLFYVADVRANGHPMNGEINVDLDASELLAIFPLKGEGRARLIGTVRHDALLRGGEMTFADVSDRAMRQLSIGVTEVNWFSTYHVHHRVASRFRGGRAFLVGDAAHIHSPVGGQGMNTGIGDAVNLAWKLASVVQGRAPETLLDSYEPERIAFARRLVATTDRAFTIATRDGPVARLLRLYIVPAIAALLSRLPRVRRIMFQTISQTSIQYRGSSLSEGCAGRVCGGDRLPWVRFSATEDNFIPLRTLQWQVHVYGAATAELRTQCEALGLAMHVFCWDQSMKSAGLMEHGMYLVRPDGYVALADATGLPARLAAFVAERGLRGFAANASRPRQSHEVPVADTAQ